VEGATPAETQNIDPSRIRISLLAEVEATEPALTTTAKRDGSFTIEDVGPGPYYLQTSGPAGTYLAVARLGKQDVTGEGLNFSTSSGDLQIVFRYGRAQLGGTVQMPRANGGADQAPVPCTAAAVVLITDYVNADGSGMYFGNVNQNGVFHFDNLKPGHYRAYALAEGHVGPLQDANVRERLSSKGVEITVEDKESKHLQLTFVPEDELLAIYGDTQ